MRRMVSFLRFNSNFSPLSCGQEDRMQVVQSPNMKVSQSVSRSFKSSSHLVGKSVRCSTLRKDRNKFRFAEGRA